LLKKLRDLRLLPTPGSTRMPPRKDEDEVSFETSGLFEEAGRGVFG
jgi:hypothetical protein